MKSEDSTKELRKIVNGLKESSRYKFSDIKKSTVELIQSMINLSKKTEGVLSACDNIMDLVAKYPVDAKLFKDFTKHRDLTRDMIQVLKMKVSVDKEFVDIMNAFQLWATQK